MKKLKHLFVSDWGRFVPGFLFCLVFAFLGMNLDHFIANYHKANVAAEKIPALEQQLQEMMESGGDAEALKATQTAIEKQRAAVAKVGGADGQRWGPGCQRR